MTIPAAALLQIADPQRPLLGLGPFLGFTLLKLIIVFTVYMVGVALLTLAERKISAWMQDRHGPNRVGPGGLGQPLADGIKNIFKEETTPGMVNKALFNLAPALAFIPALIVWAVVPFGAPWPTRWGLVELSLAPLPIGFLYVLALTSLGVYGIVLAGWSSNNKYALLGGLRSSAQMISYEIAMGMSLIPVLLLSGTVTLNGIVTQQALTGYNVILATVACFIFIVAAFAETNRLPFDLPEAESELITGYHTEYSSMKFSFFFIAEYANMVTASAMISTLFFGGYDVPFTLRDNIGPFSWWLSLLSIGIMLVKILFFIFFFMWIRWTLPRFRYDQLMALGWKILLPVALAYIVIMASALLALDRTGMPRTGWTYPLILFALNLVIVVVLFFILDRGRIISPASRRMRESELARLRAMSGRSALAPPAGD